MAQNLIQAQGGQAQKQTHFVSLFTSRFMTGMYTNRSLLRGPLSFLYSDYYHAGTTDALCDGLNSEVSIRQSIIRRPGNPAYCSQNTAGAIDAFYSFHQSDGTISVIADSAVDVEVVTPSALTSIFTKSSGAGQGYFAGIDKSMYISDGVDLVKYIPSRLNPVTGNYIWNWGGAAPTVAPTLSITLSGSSGIAWVANTMWTTMGFVVDAAGNVHQMTSVNASGTNSTQLGTTGNGAPNFSGGPTTTVTDGGVTWTNYGLITTWAPGKAFCNATYGDAALPCIIYDSKTSACYLQINGSPSQSRLTGPGPNPPPFSPTFGWTHGDGQCKWVYIGTLKVPQQWQPSHAYPTWGSVSFNDSVSCIVTPTTVAAAFNGGSSTPAYLWVATTGGTSGSSGAYIPNWATVAGNPTMDGDIIWNCLGSGTRLDNTVYSAWASDSNDYSVIKVNVSGTDYMYVCVSSTGATASSAPSFAGATLYGQTVQDGTNPGTTSFTGTTWYCVGPKTLWAANTQWYLPVGGFVPPQPSQAYGSATLSEAGINQYVTISGKSGGSAPAWAGLHLPTTDGGVTWYADSAYTAVGASWSVNRGYCYSYFARTTTDVDVTDAPPLQMPGTNSPNITGPLGPPTGCADGSVTTASPVTQITGGSASAQVLITMVGSTDPQFDTIRVYRSADGFSASGPYLFLTDIPMPPMVGVNPGIAQIIDFMPDLPSGLLPGLDPSITAPVDNENDPPPGQYGSLAFTATDAVNTTTAKAGTAIIGQVYHQGRLWAFLGNRVFASGGPDTVNGNGFTAWPPGNVFPFNSNVVRLEPTSGPLLVFTTTDVYAIGGGPNIGDYYSQMLAPTVGLGSYNALTMVLGLPYLFTSDRQFVSVDPSGGFTRIGHPIGDKLSLYTPSQVYVTYHSYGDQEHALFISNGSTEWYRCDPYPTPDSQMTGPIWSPKATISGGFKALVSVETSSGKQLFIGPTGVGKILARDSTFTTFADNGAAYSSYATIGNVVLAHAGQMAECDFITGDFMKVGTQPSVSIMFDELSPTNGAAFELISDDTVSDPPKLYGPTATPNTMWSNRYFFGQNTATPDGTPVPAWCKSFQMKVDFGNTDTVQNELLAFTVFGALYQEK